MNRLSRVRSNLLTSWKHSSSKLIFIMIPLPPLKDYGYAEPKGSKGLRDVENGDDLSGGGPEPLRVKGSAQ